MTFFDEAVIPTSWHDCLHCRYCKRKLVLYIGRAFPDLPPILLHGTQEPVIGGCFEGVHQEDAIVISHFSVYVQPNLISNAEEADTRVWLHAYNSCGHKKN